LEYTLSDKNTNLEDAPPLDSIIRALGCVPMSSFSDNDIRLLVLDLREQFGELPHFKESEKRLISQMVSNLQLLEDPMGRRLLVHRRFHEH